MDTQSSLSQIPMKSNKTFLSIKETFKEAWQDVHGFKGTFWLALFIIFVILLTFGSIQSLLTQFQTTNASPFQHAPLNILILSGLISIISNIVNALLSDGLYYIALRRTNNLPILSRMIFTPFQSPYLLKLLAVLLIKYLIVMVYVGVILSCTFLMPHTEQWRIALISIYVISTLLIIIIMFRLLLSELIILDKKQDAWSAITLSFNTTRGYLLRLFCIVILQILIILLSVIPLGIGLIWSLPLGYLIVPVIYKKLIGISMTE